MIEEMKIKISWEPNIKKYQAVVNYMITASEQYFQRNETDTWNEERKKPLGDTIEVNGHELLRTGNYIGSKSGLMQKVFEFETIQQILDEVKKIGT